MQKDFDRLNEMVGRLLTVARLDTSATPAEMKPLDFGALVAEVAADAEFESRELNCNVQLSGDNHINVRGNSDLLRSAVENIVRNAIRYTAPGTTVNVNLQRRNSAGLTRSVLTVRDHGPGVAESELANIFQPFYRIEDARDRQSGGVGLGLAISDRVARLHGGMVTASNATDGGLQVEFEIPAAEVTAET
jgi:two-component system sensor histidine kinase CpxA